jgi:diaminopimelate epimerase
VTAYYKLSGAGNDFLALVEPAREPAPGEIRDWCRRGLSVGADGLFTLERADGGARMVHWNADGGRSTLCLNGGRCAARLAFELGWGHGDELRLATDAGDLTARHTGSEEVALELPPIVGEAVAVTLTVGGEAHRGWRVRVGVPHFVHPWPASVAGVPIRDLGPALRHHPDLAPEGANVDFVHHLDRHRFEIRSWERGIEGETLACGTGIVAATAAGVAAGGLEPPVTVHTAGGCQLRVGGAVVGRRLRRATLAGDARLLTRGELLPGAGTVPSGPEWG